MTLRLITIVHILAIVTITSVITSCGTDDTGQVYLPQTSNNYVTISGTFKAAVIDQKPGSATGQITSLYVNGEFYPIAQSWVYYDISLWGHWNIYLSGINSAGEEIAAISMNNVYGNSYLDSSSKEFLPAYPARASFLSETTGAYFEAKPQFYGSGGILSFNRQSFSLPKAGQEIDGYFEMKLIYKQTYQTAYMQANPVTPATTSTEASSLIE